MVPFCSERNPLVRVSTVHCSSVMRTERACAPCTLIGPHSARPGLFGLRILPLALSGSKRSRALRVLAWTTDSFTMRRRFVPSPRKTPRRRGYYNRKRLNVFGRSGGSKLVRTESECSALRSLLLLPGIPSPMKGSVSTRRPPWSRLSNAATLQRARFGCSLSRGFEVHVGSSPSAAVIQKVAAHTAREHASVVCSTLGSQVSRSYRRSLARSSRTSC